MKKIWIIESCGDCMKNIECVKTLDSFKKRVHNAIKYNQTLGLENIPDDCPLETYKE